MAHAKYYYKIDLVSRGFSPLDVCTTHPTEWYTIRDSNPGHPD